MSTPESPTLRTARWTVVVPVKPAAVGKSRLGHAGIERDALARAISLDTVAAASAVARVVVVTDDADVAAGARGLGARVVGEGDTRGLGAAIATGVASIDTVATGVASIDTVATGVASMNTVATGVASIDTVATGVAVDTAAAAGGHRAALLGDLPALQPGELAVALADAERHDRAVVADAEGTGSTLLTARAGVPWRSAFGEGSFARHVGMGAAPLDVPAGSTLRRDVDTVEQLDAAAALGLGPRTTALLRGASGTTAPPDSERLRFREMEDDDLDDIAGLLGDPAVMTYYPRPRTRAESAAWIAWSRRNYAQHGFGLWVVESRDGRFLGDCGLTWQPVGGGRRLEVGYHLRPEAQGHGYATEAAAACRDLARSLGFAELIADIHPDNAASIGVARRIGMTFERDDVHPGGAVIAVHSMRL